MQQAAHYLRQASLDADHPWVSVNLASVNVILKVPGASSHPRRHGRDPQTCSLLGYQLMCSLADLITLNSPRGELAATGKTRDPFVHTAQPPQQLVVRPSWQQTALRVVTPEWLPTLRR